MNKKNGFSLIELIIVIIIIGIMIGAVLGMLGSKETAKYIAASSQISKIKKTADSYLKTKGLVAYSIFGNNGKTLIDNYLTNPVGLNPWSKSYKVTGDTNGLHISTDVGSSKGCKKLINQFTNRSNSAICAGNVITITYSD